MPNFGEKIKMLRTAKGLSLEQLAQEIGVTRQAIYKYEQGVSLPTILVAKQLARVFRVSIDELVA
jgi:transcriptional regulator with XRE-family HTH domain